MHAVKHGLSNREIARRRGISLDAVKDHVSNAVMKLGLADRNSLKFWHRAPRVSALEGNIMQDSIAIPATAAPSVALGSLGQIARTVRDIKQSEAWYRDVLGVPHLYTGVEEWLAVFKDIEGRPMALMSQAVPARAAS